MQVTHQADYAIRTMFYLSRLEPSQKVATSQIASEYKIPPSFLTKIISQLSIAGLIHTSRGARGELPWHGRLRKSACSTCSRRSMGRCSE